MDLNRLRTIVKAGLGPSLRELTYVPEVGPRSSIGPRDVADAMGGQVVETPVGACLVIERVYDGWAHHGRRRVTDWCDLVSGAEPLALVARAWPGTAGWPGGDRPPRLMFLDLETTGLSGGAGNHAFLVGCGYLDGDGGFRTRQIFLTSFGGERALLSLLTDWLAEVDAIVTFNGRTFDVPVIETRWLFHRMEPPLGSKPHLDVLHPARCLWRDRDRTEDGSLASSPAWESSATADGASCSLGALERWLLGFTRIGDVGGFEIPGRYFQYLRTGNLDPLKEVLEHNRLDLLSLSAVTGRVLQLVGEGAAGSSSARECVALGRLFERGGESERAADCYARAAGITEPGDSCLWFEHVSGDLRGEALRRLALHYRRNRRYKDAAATWRRILDLEHRTPLLDWQATEALAIHHEHRVRDLDAAYDFATRALEAEIDADRRRAVRHRLARLERKLDRRTLLPSL